MEQQQKPPLFSKGKMIFSFLLLTLIFIGELVLHSNHLPTWPAFACMVLFFFVHMDPKQIPNVIIGSCFGILQYPGIMMFIKAFAPAIGVFPAQVIYILLFVFLIVLLKDHIPWLFNSNAFMFFIITAVAAKQPAGIQTMQWIGVQLIGGGALVLGVYGINKIVAAIMGAQQPSAQQSTH